MIYMVINLLNKGFTLLFSQARNSDCWNDDGELRRVIGYWWQHGSSEIDDTKNNSIYQNQTRYEDDYFIQNIVNHLYNKVKIKAKVSCWNGTYVQIDTRMGIVLEWHG